MSDDLSIPNPGYRGSRAGRYGTGQALPRAGMDPDTRRLVMFAGGLATVLVALIGASAFVGRHGGEIPVVAADTRPIRVKPDNPGGMKIDGAENDVFSGGSDTENARLAPAAETPDAKGLSAPPVATSVARTAVPGTALSGATDTSLADTSASSTPPAAARPTGVPVTPNAGAAVAGARDARPAAKPQPAAVEPHASAPVHQAMVQLAALPSEEAARNEWQHLSKRMPELLNGHQPSFSRTERDGHTFWRVRTSGFSDLTQARGFCDRVRAKGGGCSVADF